MRGEWQVAVHSSPDGRSIPIHTGATCSDLQAEAPFFPLQGSKVVGQSLTLVYEGFSMNSSFPLPTFESIERKCPMDLPPLPFIVLQNIRPDLGPALLPSFPEEEEGATGSQMERQLEVLPREEEQN